MRGPISIYVDYDDVLSEIDFFDALQWYEKDLCKTEFCNQLRNALEKCEAKND